jgi:hypothetical protein
MDDKIKELENEVDLLKKRNARVESDKAWETSNFRIACIVIITYIVAAVVFYLLIGARNVFLNALVPTIGYLLSTQSLPIVKKWWLDKFFKNSK